VTEGFFFSLQTRSESARDAIARQLEALFFNAGIMNAGIMNAGMKEWESFCENIVINTNISIFTAQRRFPMYDSLLYILIK